MTVQLKSALSRATPIVVLDAASFQALKSKLPKPTQNWLAAIGFTAKPDSHALVPGADGKIEKVLAGVASVASPWVLSALPMALPEGAYALSDEGLAVAPEQAALSWELGSYHFDVYKARPRASATLLLKPGIEAERGLAVAAAMCAARDLINTPAEHMGPAELAAAAQVLAKQHGAKFKQIVGDELLKKGFPAVHAVGRASTRAPRLIELNWGKAKDPLISLVGKGVCFDTGGISLKPADGMEDMKWDMGGAGAVAGLMHVLAGRKAKVNAVGILGLVENMPDGNAQRPGDVVTSMSGQTIEIINTDAEGRLVLADAIWYCQDRFKPKFMVDLATLTGAIIISLGNDYAGLFSNNDELSENLLSASKAEAEPLWRMPLPAQYDKNIDSMIADMKNTGGRPGGSITAALFIQRFVNGVPWAHLDIASTAWKKPSTVPTIPDGATGFGVRLLNRMVAEHYEE